MRKGVHYALIAAVTAILLFLTLLSSHRSDWRHQFTTAALHQSSWSVEGDEQKLWIDQAATRPFEAPKESDLNSMQSRVKALPNSTTSTISHLITPSSLPVEASPKAVVMARLSSENTSWVLHELPEWKPYIYTVDDTSAPLHTYKNKGREALAYLTYIVDHYEDLADTIAFIHSHRDGYPAAWHTDTPTHNNVDSLRTLQIGYIQEQGYANLRCNPQVGCSPPEIQLTRKSKDPERQVELAMPEAWRQLMGDQVPLPDTLAVPCCAQFAVSRNQVRAKPKKDYERYLQWILDTGLSDDVSGRIMEYLWHVIFGRAAIFCPELSTCYCSVYGRC